MTHSGKSRDRKSQKKDSAKEAKNTISTADQDPMATPAGEFDVEQSSSSIQHHAALLSNTEYRPIQRQSIARNIGRRLGNRYLRKVMVQMKENEESGKGAVRQSLPVTNVGPIQQSEELLSNGLIRQSVQVPFTQVIAREEENPEEASQQQPEETIHVSEIPGGEDEIDHPGHDSSITSRLEHEVETTEGGEGPSGFGVTRCSWSIQDVDISSSLGTIFNSGTYTVRGKYHYDIAWRVRDALGPSNEVDIAGDSDSDVKATNYQFISKDLTPNMGDLGGRPPRDGYWAKDLTTRHELIHAADYRRTGRDAFRAAQRWLGRQTSTSASHIRDTLLQQAVTEGGRVLELRMAAPPGAEQRAYGDGAPVYTDRANRIKGKGDAGDYGKVSVKVKVLPKGGGTHEVVADDTLSSISEQIYGHSRYWPQIRDANPGKTRRGGNIIHPGTVLTLPEINIDKTLQVDLAHDTEFATTPLVTITGGSSHEFLVDPQDIFSDATNNSGDVDIHIMDADWNTLQTVTWSLPNTYINVSSDFEITARIKT